MFFLLCITNWHSIMPYMFNMGCWNVYWHCSKLYFFCMSCYKRLLTQQQALHVQHWLLQTFIDTTERSTCSACGVINAYWHRSNLYLFNVQHERLQTFIYTASSTAFSPWAVTNVYLHSIKHCIFSMGSYKRLFKQHQALHFQHGRLETFIYTASSTAFSAWDVTNVYWHVQAKYGINVKSNNAFII